MIKRNLYGVAAGALIMTTSPVFAEGGDPAAGRQAAETCFGCHAIEGYYNVYPSFHVPRIGGQQAAYIAAALKEYRDGGRKHATMHANAANLTDEMIANIATYVATQGK